MLKLAFTCIYLFCHIECLHKKAILSAKNEMLQAIFKYVGHTVNCRDLSLTGKMSS